jgi:hypothetical protein
LSKSDAGSTDRTNSPTTKDLEKLGHREQVCFAVACAESVFHLVAKKDKPVCRASIDAAIGFVEGKVSAEECRVAADAAADAAAATDAAADAAADAAYVAADAAAATYAAADAAAATYAAYASKDKQKLIEQQWQLYDDLLSLDSNLVSILN